MVLNRPLRSLDVCYLWLLGLWHGAHASAKGVVQKPSISSDSRPTGPHTASMLLTVCGCCSIAFTWMKVAAVWLCMQMRTSAWGEGVSQMRTRGGVKITKLLRTPFMDNPLQKIPQSLWLCHRVRVASAVDHTVQQLKKTRNSFQCCMF